MEVSLKTRERFLQWGLILLFAGAPFLSNTLELWGVTPLRLLALFLLTFLFLSSPLTFRLQEWRATRIIFLALAGFFLWGSLSLFYSPEPFEAFQVLLSWGYNFSVFFLAYTLFKDSSLFKRASQAFLVATVFLSFFGLYQYYFEYETILKEVLADPQKYGGPRIAYMWPLFNKQPLATYINPNLFATHLGIAIVLNLSLWWEIKRPFRPWRQLVLFLIYPLSLVLYLYCFVLISSRGGLLATLGGILIMIILMGAKYMRERRLHLLIFALLIITVVGFRLATYPKTGEVPFLERTATLAFPALVMQPRAHYYQAAEEMIKKKPLHGWGLGSFGTIYHRYRPEGAEYTKFAHSFPIQLAAETGLIGLTLWATIIGGIISLLIKRGRGLRQRWERPLWVMLCSSLLVLFLHSLVDFDLEIVGPATFFWISLGALVGGLTPKETEGPPQVPIWQKLLYVLPFTLLTAFLIVIPFWAQTLAQEGQKLLESHQPFKAVDAFKHSLLINPYDPNTYASLGQAYREIYQKEGGNPAFLNEAQNTMEKALSLAPANFAYHQGLGWIFLLKAQKDQRFLNEAESEFLKAAQLAPQALTSHRDLSILYQMQGRNEEAQREQVLWEKVAERERAKLTWVEETLKLRARFLKDKERLK